MTTHRYAVLVDGDHFLSVNDRSVWPQRAAAMQARDLAADAHEGETYEILKLEVVS